MRAESKSFSYHIVLAVIRVADKGQIAGLGQASLSISM